MWSHPSFCKCKSLPRLIVEISVLSLQRIKPFALKSRYQTLYMCSSFKTCCDIRKAWDWNASKCVSTFLHSDKVGCVLLLYASLKPHDIDDGDLIRFIELLHSSRHPQTKQMRFCTRFMVWKSSVNYFFSKSHSAIMPRSQLT